LQEAAVIVDKTTKPPETFQDYLNAIKWQTWTHSTLLAFLKTNKTINSNQKSMILSKLKT